MPEKKSRHLGHIRGWDDTRVITICGIDRSATRYHYEEKSAHQFQEVHITEHIRYVTCKSCIRKIKERRRKKGLHILRTILKMQAEIDKLKLEVANDKFDCDVWTNADRQYEGRQGFQRGGNFAPLQGGIFKNILIT